MFEDANSAAEQQPKDAVAIYEQNIDPGSTVIVVGPNGRIARDPTLLVAAIAVGPDGQVLIADPQGHMLDVEEYDAAVERAGSVIAGYGDVEQHLSELHILRAMGVNLKMPSWLGPMCTAQNLRDQVGAQLPGQSVDAIVDHGTSPFIISAWGTGQIDNPDALAQIYREYARVLRPGGRLLLQLSPSSYHMADGQELNYELMLQEAGFSVVSHNVSDLMHVPVGGDVLECMAASVDPSIESFVLGSTANGSGAILGGTARPAVLFVAQKLPHATR